MSNFELDFDRMGDPRRGLQKLRRDLDKALAEMKTERAYRKVNYGEDNYPWDSRVPGEISGRIEAAMHGACYAARQVAHFRALLANYEEHQEYLEAMSWLLQRELEHYFKRPKL